MIDDVEAALACRPVDARDVDQDLEEAARIVAQELQNLDDLRALDRDGQLAEGDARRYERATELCGDVVSKRAQVSGHRHRSIVPVRRIFLCNSSTP